MSGTKYTARWIAKGPTDEALAAREVELRDAIVSTKNALVRSSLLEQKRLVRAEIGRRAMKDAITLPEFDPA